MTVTGPLTNSAFNECDFLTECNSLTVHFLTVFYPIGLQVSLSIQSIVFFPLMTVHYIPYSFQRIEIQTMWVHTMTHLLFNLIGFLWCRIQRRGILFHGSSPFGKFRTEGKCLFSGF